MNINQQFHVNVFQTAIRSFGIDVEIVNELIGSYRRHTPEKPGCPEYWVFNLENTTSNIMSSLNCL
jgi:hypothetical protein